MDKRFTPRSNEEMLAAVRAFQARQKAFMERMDAKLAAFLKKPLG